ncbi:hypothetical protein C8Q76DRAFT_798089 [Earliella scabrosa]|nr:hypothetical protein C8Q76DRAFT_798089 [Earliella scabrosa]
MLRRRISSKTEQWLYWASQESAKPSSSFTSSPIAWNISFQRRFSLTPESAPRRDGPSRQRSSSLSSSPEAIVGLSDSIVADSRQVVRLFDSQARSVTLAMELPSEIGAVTKELEYDTSSTNVPYVEKLGPSTRTIGIRVILLEASAVMLARNRRS